MKKYFYIILMILGLFLGVSAAFSSIKFVLAILAGIILLSLLLLDYQKATFILAFYVVTDYVLRNLIDNPFLAGNWDEIFFILCIGIWFYKWFTSRKEPAYTWTPLEIPLFFFFGVSIILLIINSPDMSIGIAGLRQVIEYMFWFFVVVQLLKSEDGARHLILLLVLIGTGVALYGIYQYYAGVDVPTSWIDQAENAVGIRIFSIVVSPNILGSLMVLTIPLSVSFIYSEKRILKKLFFFACAISMFVCMIFTSSRSALIGLLVAALIFVFLKDRRLIIPLALLCIAAFLFIPQINTRINYLLSPDYMISSAKGGRLARWPMGIELFKENLLSGVGLGRFGGAVAAINKVPDSFYMDNYYLKTAVEMGIFGISAFLILMYNVLIWSIRAIKRITDKKMSTLVQAAIASMSGVLVTNFFENVFEVPVMVTYFWIIVAVVMYLGYVSNTDSEALK
ncbi:MAG: O-antigen ligase family protein [Clostridia bacterium]|jgi:O-antigen ligase